MSLSQYFPELWSCDLCHGLAPKRPVRLVDLRQGCEAGCGICTVLSRGIAVFQQAIKSQSSKDEFKSLRWVVAHYVMPTKAKAFAFGIDERITLHILPDTLELATGRIPRIATYGPINGRDVPTELNLSRTIALTRAWMEDCERNHPQCTFSNSTPCLPTRVLDLSLAQDGPISLMISNGICAPYIALSYCWGNVRTKLKTTQDNISQYMAEIPEPLFPQVFTDAIGICRGLNVRYLWIDSLCIIQDSPEDWSEEATRMDDVYSNAWMTIAATRSSNPTEGLFSDRWATDTGVDVGSFPPLGTGSVAVEHEDYTYRIRASRWKAHHRFKFSSLLHGDSYNASPLMNRGWAYQERLLSRRTLHFHSEELVWECNGSLCCECGEMDGIITTAEDNLDFYTARTKSLLVDSRLSTLSLLALTWTWMSIVLDYSSLNLTYQSDLLPALAGLATRFSKRSPGRYIAGMWTGLLPNVFLWQVQLQSKQEPTQLPIAESKLHAPSWSWLSICLYTEQSVQYRHYGEEWTCPHFTILSIQGNLVGKSSYGWIRDAALTVRALCVECYTIGSYSLSLTYKTDDHWSEDEHRMTLFPDGIIPLKHGTKVLYMRLEQGSEAGLALLQVSTSGKDSDIYQRVGLVRMDFDWNDRWKDYMLIRELRLV